MFWLILSVAVAITTKVAAAYTPIQDVEFVRLASPSNVYPYITCNGSGYYPLASPGGWASEVNVQASQSYLTYRPSRTSCEWKRQYWLGTNYSQLCNMAGTVLVPPAGVSGGMGWVCNGVAASSPIAPVPNCGWPDWGTQGATFRVVPPPYGGVAWSNDANTGLPVCGPVERPSYALQPAPQQSSVEFWPYCFGEQEGTYQTCSSSEFPANAAPVEDYVGQETFAGISPSWVSTNRAPYALKFSANSACYATPRWVIKQAQLVDTSQSGYSAQVGQLLATSDGDSYGDQQPVFDTSGWERVQVPTAAPARWSGDYGYPWGESSSFAGVGRTFKSPYCGAQIGNATYQWGPDDAAQLKLLHPNSWTSSTDPECICMLDGACVPKYSGKQRSPSLGYVGAPLSFSVEYVAQLSGTTIMNTSTTSGVLTTAASSSSTTGAASSTTAAQASSTSTSTTTSTTTTRPSTTTTTTRLSTTTTTTTTRPSTTTTTTTRPSTTTTTTLAPTTTAFVPTVCRTTTIGVGSFELCSTWTMPTSNQLKCTLSRIFPTSQTCSGTVSSFAVADTGFPSTDDTINALCALMGYNIGTVAVGSYGTSAKAINPSFNLVSSNAYFGELWCYK